MLHLCGYLCERVEGHRANIGVPEVRLPQFSNLVVVLIENLDLVLATEVVEEPPALCCWLQYEVLQGCHECWKVGSRRRVGECATSAFDDEKVIVVDQQSVDLTPILGRLRGVGEPLVVN